MTNEKGPMGSATIGTVEATEINLRTGQARSAIDIARGCIGSLKALKFRLLGIQDDEHEQSDTPEWVRQEVEELQFQLATVNECLSEIDRHIGDLQRL